MQGWAVFFIVYLELNNLFFSYVLSHEKRISTILFPNVKYEDLCATINPYSKSKISKVENYSNNCIIIIKVVLNSLGYLDKSGVNYN